MKKEKSFYQKLILFSALLSMVFIFLTPIKASATEQTLDATFDSKTGIISCDLSGCNVYGLYVSRDGIHFGLSVSYSRSEQYNYHVTDIIDHFNEKNGTYVFQFYGFSSEEDMDNVENAIAKSEAFTVNYTIPEKKLDTPVISEMKLYQPYKRNKYIEIKWNSVDNANDYELCWYKDGIIDHWTKEYKNAVGYGYPESMEPGHVYTVKIKAFSNDFHKIQDSEYSISSSEISMDSEGNIYFDGNIIKPEQINSPVITDVNYFERSNGDRLLEINWSMVDDALCYQLEEYVDGNLDSTHYEDNTFYLISNPLETGHKYSFRVRAKSNNIEIMDSDYSALTNEITIDSEGNVYYGSEKLNLEKAKPEQDTVVIYDANGGKTGKYWFDSILMDYGDIVDSVLIDEEWVSMWIWEDMILPPEGKIFDGLSYNDVVYHVGDTIPDYVMIGPLTIKYLWKDADFCYEYNEGVLTLKGNIVADEIKQFDSKNQVKSIVAVDGTVFPENCSSLFEGYTACESIDFSNVDTSNVTDMSNMFSFLYVKKLDLSGFDLSSVTNAEGMFLGYPYSVPDEITLGEKFTKIDSSMGLMNGYLGWACGSPDSEKVSGDEWHPAVISNTGKNTYYKKRAKWDDLDYEFSIVVKAIPDTRIGNIGILEVVHTPEDLYNEKHLACEWRRDGELINNENSTTYLLRKEDIGHTFTCKVFDMTYETSGYKNAELEESGKVGKAVLNFTSEELEAKWKTETCSKKGATDGEIYNLNENVEYATKADFSDSQKCSDAKAEDWITTDNGVALTGFSAGTYYIRYFETDTCEASAIATVVVEDGPSDNITGTVSINGTTKFGQTLTAKVIGSNASNFSYQWKRGSNVISNATASTYKLVKEDIGQTITCVVSDKSGNTLGSISGTSAKIEKADGPAAPSNLKGVACTKKGASDGKITGVSTSMEYATKSDFSDKKKCSSTEITGLKAGTYYVRIAETDTTKVGSSTTVTVEDAKEQTQDELVTDFVKRFYKEVLGRSDKAIEEDEAGITDWANKLINKEKTGAQVAQGFVASKEFKNRGVSDEEYVTIMYVAFFGRDPDEGGYNGWLSKLKSGTSREAVLAGFTNSKEFQNLCAKYGIEPGKLDTNDQSQQNNNQQNNNQQNNNNQSGMRPPLKLDSSNVDEKQLDDFVERLYDKVLGRKSDEGGKTYWLSAIMEGHDDRGNTYDAAIAIRKGFFESKEYLSKGRNDDEFLTDLYWAFFNREPDEGGYTYWQKKMKNEGYSRQRVIDEGFGHSKEFKNLLTSYGFKIIE